MLNISQKPRILEGITPANLTEDIIYSSTPIVLKGFCEHWPITQAGLKSPEEAASYLKSVYSGLPVSGTYGPPENNGRVFYNKDFTGFNFSASQVDLKVVLEQLLLNKDNIKPPTMYVASTEAGKWFPKLLEDNNFTIPNTKPLTSLWIGNQSVIAAHYDFPTNIACNVVGKRVFTLFPPDQIANLYPGPIEFAPGGQEISLVDFSAPDFEQFPKFKQAIEHAQRAELSPGDALILPSMWWHHVQAFESLNVLITHWWRNTPGYMGRPNNALSMAILAIRSLPKDQRMAWKHIFDHYVFNEELDQHDHIPDSAKDILTLPLDEMSARKLRADLSNKLKR